MNIEEAKRIHQLYDDYNAFQYLLEVIRKKHLKDGDGCFLFKRSRYSEVLKNSSPIHATIPDRYNNRFYSLIQTIMEELGDELASLKTERTKKWS